MSFICVWRVSVRPTSETLNFHFISLYRYGNLTPDEREDIGYMCKRLIDYGRVKYLMDNDYAAKIVLYIDKKYSLEDCAIIANTDSEKNKS